MVLAIMIIKIAKYTIKADKQTIVEAAIRSFVTHIHTNEPNTYYEAYQVAGSMDFIHIMKFPDQGSEHAHAHAPYTQEFVKILYPECTKKPEFIDLSLIR